MDEKSFWWWFQIMFDFNQYLEIIQFDPIWLIVFKLVETIT